MRRIRCVTPGVRGVLVKARARCIASHKGQSACAPSRAPLIGSGIGRLSNLVIERGEGSYLYTADGEKYLDFACGIGVTNLGHKHPAVTAAVHEQVDKVWHAQVNIVHHAPMLDLVGKLRSVMPVGSGLDTFLFVTTGAEAVEAAAKLAKHATGKPNMIVFQGSYHGRTALTGAMTTSKNIFRARYGPAPSGIFVAPFPSPHYGGLSVESCLEQLELLLATQTCADEIGAVFIEPVLGEGGYIPTPPAMLQGIRDFCTRHGILMVADEVQTGFGRTGRMFAIERACAPDIIVFAKGIANGMPLAGIVSRKDIMDKQPAGSQGGTYAGNAVACAAANAALEVYASRGFMDHVNARGAQLMEGMRAIGKRLPASMPMIDVRGHGLMIGVELDKAVVPKGTANAISKQALDHGLICLNTGIFETFRLVPPLNVSEEECVEALEKFEAAMHVVAGEIQ